MAADDGNILEASNHEKLTVHEKTEIAGGVPAVVDLASMREAMRALGGDPEKINPLVPAELVIDHSVIADVFGRPDAFERNVELEFQRNSERFAFLRWGQQALRQFRVVPPGTVR